MLFKSGQVSALADGFQGERPPMVNLWASRGNTSLEGMAYISIDVKVDIVYLDRIH